MLGLGPSTFFLNKPFELVIDSQTPELPLPTLDILLSIVFRLCDLSLCQAPNIYISESRKKITFTSASKISPLS